MSKLKYAVREAVYDWENKKETPWLPHPEYTDIQMKRVGSLWLYVQISRFNKETTYMGKEYWSWTIQLEWDGQMHVSSNSALPLSEATAKECAEAVARIINKEMKEKENGCHYEAM